MSNRVEAVRLSATSHTTATVTFDTSFGAFRQISTCMLVFCAPRYTDCRLAE